MIHLLHFEGEEALLDALLSPWMNRLKDWRSAAYFQKKFPKGQGLPASAASRRRQSATAWALLEQALRRELGLELSALEIEATSFQKPVCVNFPSLFFSLTHCEGMAACILADHPVGIDCESIRPTSRQLVERVCPPGEVEEIFACSDPEDAFCQHWTLKESFVKAVGTGLSFSLRRAAFRLGNGEIRLELDEPARPEERTLLQRYPRSAFVLHPFGQRFWVAGCVLHGESETALFTPQIMDKVCTWSLKDLAQTS